MFEKGIQQTAREIVTSVAVVTLIWTLCLAQSAGAQGYGGWRPVSRIDPGTTVEVRTTETINKSNADGQVFTGIVDRDVLDRNGDLAIPAGATAELIVRTGANNELVLDLDSITVNGERYGVTANPRSVGTTGGVGNSGIGNNPDTVKHVGGGALLGGLIGAIAGGAKGAAIGAAVGAGAGAGVQILTHGRTVQVPAETLLTYRLDEGLDLGVNDDGYTRDGRHYHKGY